MKKFFILILIFFAVLLALYALLWVFKFASNSNMLLGASFSAEHARYLGLDPRETLEKILNDWNFKYLRLSAYWNRIEKRRGQYDFSDLDWQMALAKKYGAKVMLAAGQKIPRWPECHLPEWTQELSSDEYYAELLNFIRAAAERYANNPALEIWQVENEPFLPFGVCPPYNKDMLAGEISAVKTADPRHPTITTDSGELSLWFRTSRAADLFGVTMYRTVWNKYFGYWGYGWLPPSYYSLRAWLNDLPASKVFISELQAEPWMPRGAIFDVDLPEQYKSMNAAQLEKNLRTARGTGFARAYLWGAEWWHWLEKQGETELPDFIKRLEK